MKEIVFSHGLLSSGGGEGEDSDAFAGVMPAFAGFMRRRAGVWILLTLLAAARLWAAEPAGFVPLFPEDGLPKGWVVRLWSDVSKPPEQPAVWKVENGILQGGEPRGNW